MSNRRPVRPSTTVGPRAPAAPVLREPRATTFVESIRLSERLGADVVLATETFQWTGSFKFRAAYHVATHVPHPAIITGSSGNFGQAMAFACQLTGKRCTVVMPRTAVAIKVDAVRRYGASVDLVDTTHVTRDERVAALAAEQPDAYVASPYDDPLVIAGNATLGAELAAAGARAARPFDGIVAAIGGGGLASGIIAGLRAADDVTPVWGAEPALANDFAQSHATGRRVVHAQEMQTIADGARTRGVGAHNWAVLEHGVAGVIEVPEAAIVDAVRALCDLANLKAEPTGALTVAALAAEPERFRGQRICCIISGGNADPVWFGRIIAERP